MSAGPLIIVCDWLPPVFGAVGQYEMARAEAAAAAGRETILIGLGTETAEESRLCGRTRLTVRRLAARPAPKGDILRRALWTLGVVPRLLAALRRAARERPDAQIKVTGAPPFFADAVLLWSRLSGRGVTYRITDFYPETALAAGRLRVLAPLAPLFRRLRGCAARIEAVSKCQERRLRESGAPADRVTVVRDGSPVVFTGREKGERRPFGPDALTLLYSGNLGAAHDWRSFAEGYARHVGRGGPARLWLNACGSRLGELRAFCEARSLPVAATPPSPLAELSEVMASADAHLILLGEPFWGFVFPSKVYAALASGKPTLYVGPAQSDAHALLRTELIGSRNESVRQGEPDAVAAALDRLAARWDRGRRRASARASRSGARGAHRAGGLSAAS